MPSSTIDRRGRRSSISSASSRARSCRSSSERSCVTTGARSASPGPARRRRPDAAALAVALDARGRRSIALLAGFVAALAFDRGRGLSAHGATDLRTFVFRVENLLVQAREGRREVVAAIRGVERCRLGPRVAIDRLNRVQRNRQSLLQQVAALVVPSHSGADASGGSSSRRRSSARRSPRTGAAGTGLRSGRPAALPSGTPTCMPRGLRTSPPRTPRISSSRRSTPWRAGSIGAPGKRRSSRPTAAPAALTCSASSG